MNLSELWSSLDGENVAEMVPETVRLWLADKYKMCGIPFQYLVPDEKMLPPESVRFFYVDKNWLEALTAGVLSIGRQTGMDGMINKAVYSLLVPQSFRLLPKRRFEQMHENHRKEEIRLNGAAMPEFIEEDQVLSGFILRSCIARYWKGIEVSGYDKQRKRGILRLDTLASDIILCIFDGQIDRVRFLEPAEDLHFEAEDVCCGAADNQICVREITGEVGKYTGKKAAFPVNSRRRADIRALAGSVREALGCGADMVHSAELALQLLSSADSFEIKNGGKEKDGTSACTDRS